MWDVYLEILMDGKADDVFINSAGEIVAFVGSGWREVPLKEKGLRVTTEATAVTSEGESHRWSVVVENGYSSLPLVTYEGPFALQHALRCLELMVTTVDNYNAEIQAELTNGKTLYDLSS